MLGRQTILHGHSLSIVIYCLVNSSSSKHRLLPQCNNEYILHHFKIAEDPRRLKFAQPQPPRRKSICKGAKKAFLHLNINQIALVTTKPTLRPLPTQPIQINFRGSRCKNLSCPFHNFDRRLSGRRRIK